MADNKKALANLRREYTLNGLAEANCDASPFNQFDHWFKDAVSSIDENAHANAMQLSTATKDGKPSSRIVLLKDYSEAGLTFFTNYDSRKAQEIAENPQVSLLFFWEELERQIRIEGTLIKTSREISDEYFHSRPVESQLGAICSEQSAPLDSRETLEKAFNAKEEKYGDQIPLPDNWGGYTVIPDYFEFWQGRQNRLHDRVTYTLEDDSWVMGRISP